MKFEVVMSGDQDSSSGIAATTVNHKRSVASISCFTTGSSRSSEACAGLIRGVEGSVPSSNIRNKPEWFFTVLLALRV